MKTLIALTLIAFAFVANGQTATNVTLKFSGSVIVAGVSTNNFASTITLDPSNKKDQTKLTGLSFACGSCTNSIGTNAPIAFEAWAKNTFQAVIGSCAGQAQQAANAATLIKLASLLTANSDLLSAPDLSNLATIAAKAP